MAGDALAQQGNCEIRMGGKGARGAVSGDFPPPSIISFSSEALE